jgi:hypothetical protein
MWTKLSYILTKNDNVDKKKQVISDIKEYVYQMSK